MMKQIPTLTFSAIALAILSFTGTALQAGEQRGTTPPNILFILVDDQRFDTVGYAGNSVIQTPALDLLAADGARFDALYSAGPRCAPSRASLLTGLYPHQQGNGIQTNKLYADFSSETPTLAEYLNEADYLTAFVGKAHLGGDPKAWGFQHTPIWLATGATAYEDPRLMLEGRQSVVRGSTTEIFSRAAVEFLEDHGSSQPWFLWLATTAPHAPTCLDCNTDFPYNQATIEATPPPGLPPGTPMTEVDWASYYSTITHLDNEIDLILDTLITEGLDSNTYVFVISDNGIMNGSHGITSKGVWYEESVRLMGVARGPGIAPGTVFSDPASVVDFLPTFLEIAGVSIPSALEGVSLLPGLTGGSTPRTTIFAEMDSSSVAPWEMVTAFSGSASGYKYVSLLGGSTEMLFDLNVDPFELTDLIAGGSPPMTVLNQLRSLHSTWQSSTP